MAAEFTRRVRKLLSRIPAGRVTTYGLIAAAASNPAGARQVARILHSSSEKYLLPWHRVVNREGRISLPMGRGLEMQRDLLNTEGVEVIGDKVTDFDKRLWIPHAP